MNTTNERPTPETDEAQFGTNRVSVNFARRLERERDEARERLDGNHAALLAMEKMLYAERALADRLAEVLQRIANEDYRGNRPHHCAVAYYGVKAWKEARND